MYRSSPSILKEFRDPSLVLRLVRRSFSKGGSLGEGGSLFRILQLILVACLSVYLMVPPQAWACGSCSEVAIASSMQVETSDGSLVLDQTDVDLPGFAGVRLGRRYNSNADRFSMFGYGWEADFLCNLITVDGDIEVNLGGKGETFKVVDGYANQDRSMQLSFIGEGTNQLIEIENRFHDKWVFKTATKECTKIVDRNGNATRFETTVTNKYIGMSGTNYMYVPLFLVTRAVFGDGRDLIFTFTNNLCSSVTQPDNSSISYTYVDGLLTGVSKGQSQTLNYDYQTVTDSAKTRGWLQTITYANAAAVNIAWNGEFGSSNAALRVTGITGPHGYDHDYGYVAGTNGAMTTTLTDSRGNNTRYTTAQNGQNQSVTNALGFVQTSLQNTNGQTIKMIDQRGNAEFYVYDSANSNVLARNNRIQVTNTLGKVWNYGCDTNNFRVRSISPLNQTNQFKYDAKGNLLAVTNALGRQTVSMAYTTNGLLASSTDGRGNTTTLARNGQGLVTNTIDTLTNSWAQEYDNMGNMTRSVDPLGHVVSIAYNGYNKPSAITNALGNITQFSYDEMSNPTNVTDALGNRTSISFDQLQRKTKIKDARGYETKFSYDPESNLTVLSNALGHAYSYSFDAVNQTKTFTYPDASKESYIYDGNGNLTALTNRSGQVISAVFDAGNRMTSRTYQEGTNTVFTMGYDDVDRLISITRIKGSVTESAITNSFDAANRLTQQKQGAYAVGYSHDVNGAVTNVSYPSGLNVGYSLDALNRISAIRDSTNATALANYTVDAAGRLTKRALENGTESVYAQDAAGRVTNIILRLTSSPSTVRQSFAYGHDAVGNRTWVKYKNGRGDVYQYDATYQLTGVKYNVGNPQDGYSSATNATRTVTYSYDALGNRISVVDNLSTTSYTVNNLNQYTTVGTTNLTYDTRGNLTGDGVWTYSYDHDSHLIGASKAGTTASYTYDGAGRRISKTVNGTTTKYIYSGEDLIEERDGSGSVLVKYVYEGGVDRPVKVIKGSSTYYFQQDALGNVTALTDATGALFEQYEFDVFGRPTIKDGNGSPLTASTTPFLFTGREYDSETGLCHYRARAYSAELGRFLQADPIDFDGGDMNIYRYVANNPVNFVDPMGLDGMCRRPGWCSDPCRRQ